MTHIDFDFMTSVTMPNPRLCRIEVLKHPGNCVNPADPPSCHSAPCGIVRCASQESQRSPSPRLTFSLSFVERHRRAGQSASDRKSTRLNSSHPSISYAVFCLKKKKT